MSSCNFFFNFSKSFSVQQKKQRTSREKHQYYPTDNKYYDYILESNALFNNCVKLDLYFLVNCLWSVVADDTAQRTECPAVVSLVGGRIDAVGHW